jgi:protein phosphatase
LNEDAYAVRDPEGLYLVTDGVGGEGNGAAAAQIVAEQFPLLLKQLSQPGSQPTSQTEQVISRVVRELHQRTRAELGWGKTRATLVAALLEDNRGLVAHLGDSRAYLLRAGELTRLTKDHSFGQLLVDTGDMELGELEKSPYRSQITRCIGMAGDPAPDFREFDWRPGDLLLLCSDGLTSMLSDDVIRQVLTDVGDVTIAAGRLIVLANDAGGLDNVTVVLVRHEIIS